MAQCVGLTGTPPNIGTRFPTSCLHCAYPSLDPKTLAPEVLGASMRTSMQLYLLFAHWPWSRLELNSMLPSTSGLKDIQPSLCDSGKNIQAYVHKPDAGILILRIQHPDVSTYPSQLPHLQDPMPMQPGTSTAGGIPHTMLK
jgi:hypothetical protein